MAHHPCHPSVKLGSQAAVQTRLSVPTTKTSRWSMLRETTVTGDPGAALPPLSSHQPCQPSVNAGSHAAVCTTPFTSVTKMSNLSELRETTCTGEPAGTWMSPMGHQPCHPSVKAGSQAAVHTRPSVPTTKTSSLSLLRETAVTWAPGAATPSRSRHQPCHQSAKVGSHAAV